MGAYEQAHLVLAIVNFICVLYVMLSEREHPKSTYFFAGILFIIAVYGFNLSVRPIYYEADFAKKEDK